MRILRFNRRPCPAQLCGLFSAALLVIVALASPGAAAHRPNIVWLSCEDMGPHLGCYGDPVAQTPHIDSLARRSLRFTQACSVAGVCAPSRSAIITGVYPTTLGTHLMRCRAKLPPDVAPFPALLRRAGYYCTNNSKTDYQFEPPRDAWDESSGRAHWRRRPRPDQPFFAVFNYTGTHESAVVQPAKHASVSSGIGRVSRDLAAQTLPPYYPDTPAVREEWGRYYDCIAALDAWVGAMLEQLEADGLADNTIVFFWSDHGAGLPRAKRWLYDSGVRVPLLVHVPRALGGPAMGSESDRLVSLVDLAPTVLKLAGLEPPAVMQGHDFLSPGGSPREFQHLVRDRMDERYDIVRGVRTARWKYLRNDQPWKPYLQHLEYGEQSTIMQELRRALAKGTLPQAAKPFAAGKPREELYDLVADPHEVHNLADDPQHRQTLLALRAEQLSWSDATGDLGLLPEAELVRREAECGSRWAIRTQPSANELFQRLNRVADACANASESLDELIAMADDPDPAVRYWALIGVGLAGNHNRGKGILRRGLDDPWPCVRVAAVRGLAIGGDVGLALSALETALTGSDVWVALDAALAVDELGSAARPLLPRLQQLAQQKDDVAFGTRYAPRVARHTLQTLNAP